MDDFIAGMVRSVVPQINPIIANGLAVQHMKQTTSYIDSVLRNVSKNFPPGLEYVDLQRCTPEEEFNFETMKKNSKRTFDIARSDIYLVKLFFKFNGVPLEQPRYLYLPFVGDCSSMFLGGTRYFVHPMLSDDCFSPNEKGVFVRLLRDKINFERTPHHIKVNGEQDTVQVTHSMLYHRNQKNKKLKPSVKAECAIAHYLFCKYGVSETFRRYANCEVQIGVDQITERNAQASVMAITPETHPPEEWVICSSRGLKPAGLGKSRYLTQSNIRIAIRKKDFNNMTKSLVGGFFYVVDHFPERMAPAWVDDCPLWMRLLGLILFSDTLSEGKIYEDVRDHFLSLDEYIDNIVAVKLKESGFPCHDLYDLFAVVLANINEWVRESRHTINSMYGKELTVLYNVLYEITAAIFKMHYKLKSAAKKGLKEKDVINIMNAQFKPKIVYKILKGHSCISTDSYSGDNKVFKITTTLVQQRHSTVQTSKKERTSIRDSSKKMHVSVAENGGFQNLPKSDPSGRACINPHVQVSLQGKLLRDPSKVELLDKIQGMIGESPTG